MSTFSIWENKDKGDRFKQALIDAGYEYVPNSTQVDLLLIDLEHPTRRDRLIQADLRRTRIFIYPHAARTPWAWDGVFEPWPSVACNFTFGEGQRDVLLAYGYPRPIEVCGWTYSAVHDFKPTAGRHVTFAPIHPNTVKGNIPAEYLAMNKRVYELLLSLLPEITLKVRFGRDIKENGLWHDPRVSWELAQYKSEDSLRTIERSDIVVSHSTFAYLSVAVGIPTVMFGECMCPDTVLAKPKHWPSYQDLLHFPLDITETDDPLAMIRAAQSTFGPELQEWKRRFIGKAFIASNFVATVERYLRA